MDKLTAMKVFLDVAESNSFTATADKLELSRPMVTRQIALMEEWLNARLFHRTTRQVLLTEAGSQAVEFCQQITDLVEKMEQEIQPDEGELRGLLRIGTNISFGSEHLTAMIGRFQQQHPKLKIHLNLSDERINMAEARLDLVIRFTNSPDPTLVARPLANCRSLLVASPDYLATAGTPLTPEELQQHRCLAHSNINRSEWVFHPVQPKSKDEPPVRLELANLFSTNETTALLNAVLSSNGIAMLPRYLLNEHIARGELVPLLTDWQLPEYQIYALYLSRHKQPRALRMLLDFLVEEFKGREW